MHEASFAIAAFALPEGSTLPSREGRSPLFDCVWLPLGAAEGAAA